MGRTKLSKKNWIALGIVLALTIFLWAVPTSFFGIEGLTPVMQRTIAIFVFTALMWIIEVIPTWTTSVISMVVMLLTISNKGIGFTMYEGAGTFVDYKSIMAAFADPVIMLFLGGFVLAIAASKVGLDVAIARTLLKPFKKPKWVLLAFLLIIGVFSMFMSNTATAAMMLTFLAPVLGTLPKDEKGKEVLHWQFLSRPTSAAWVLRSELHLMQSLSEPFRMQALRSTSFHGCSAWFLTYSSCFSLHGAFSSSCFRSRQTE